MFFSNKTGEKEEEIKEAQADEYTNPHGPSCLFVLVLQTGDANCPTEKQKKKKPCNHNHNSQEASFVSYLPI